MPSPSTIVLDRVFVARRSDVIGADAELVPVKIARPVPFKTKNARGTAAVVEDYEAIIAFGEEDAQDFLNALKNDSSK